MTIGEFLVMLAFSGMVIFYSVYLWSGINLWGIASCFFFGAFGLLCMITPEPYYKTKEVFSEIRHFLFLLGAGEGA